MENKEKTLKRQSTINKNINISKFRHSVSVSTLNSHQFTFLDNSKKNYKYDDKSSSISEVNSNKSFKSADVKSNSANYNTVSDPINELSKADNVIIKVEYQSCCCINMANNLYNVFTKNKNNIKYLFKTEELMACADYSLCDYFKHPFYLNIKHAVNIGYDPDPDMSGKIIATAKRSCKYPCFCFCRPELKIKMTESQKLIGTIFLPFSFGNTDYKIYSETKKLKYIIETEYFQSGILCPKNCCGCLPEVFFDIYNDKYEKIGGIDRIPGKFKEFMHVLDCYQVFFPKKASVEDKMLLICATFMIESEIFRDKWGSLECCWECKGDTCCECNEDTCADCCLRCCGELFAGCFRF